MCLGPRTFEACADVLWFVALCWQVLTLAVTNKLSLLRPGAVPPEHETQPSAEIVRVECAKCRRERVCGCPAQPSAEIVRVKGAKCRRECVLDLARATLCGDRACRARKTQARVRFEARSRATLSCVSRARNAGESAFCICRGQPSAEIVRVEGAKCR